MAGAREDFARVARVSGLAWACTLALDRLTPLAPLRFWRPRHVSAARLGEQLATILRAWGTSDAHTAIIVARILYADLHGIDSHGCCMLPFYDRLRGAGTLRATPEITTVHDSPTTALVDGGGGLGHVPATVAMELAIAKCRASGVAAVAVRNSGHFGAAGAYAAMASDAGFLALVTTSTPTPSVVPTFGRTALLGTNPIALAAPAVRNPAFLLDMATSAASLGKLVEHWRAGKPIPTGWALDARGRATTNGRIAYDGRRLTPLGGDRAHGSHKGYGLAAAVEILSSTLPGVPLAAASGERRATVGHFMLVLDPQRFRPDGAFGTDLDELIDRLHATPPIATDQPVLVPGDPEQATHAERSAHGIPLAKSVLEDLRGVAHAAGVPFLLDGDA